LELLLRESGFERFTIYEDESTLRCVTGVDNHPFPAVEEQLGLGVQYTASVLEDLDRRNIAPEDWQRLSLSAGMRFRHFRYLVDLGQYEEARLVLSALGGMRTIPQPEPDSFAEFMQVFRCFEPSFAYYAGLLEFVSGNLDGAKIKFGDAIALCELKTKLAPSIAVTEEELVWRARFHLAAIEEEQGSRAVAVEAFERIVEAAESFRVPVDIVEQCRERINVGLPWQEDATHSVDERTWLQRFPERARGKARYEISKLLRRGA
jgi:tetratricopeptide (TPR) repeat protein